MKGSRDCALPRSQGLIKLCSGISRAELLVAIVILATLTFIAVSSYERYLEKAKITRVKAEIRLLESEIKAYEIANGNLPATLADIGREALRDPDGNPYHYANGSLVQPEQRRKDLFLVPLNSDFDLYSKGKDGKSNAPLAAKHSQDDIVRANDGEYVGLASKY